MRKLKACFGLCLGVIFLVASAGNLFGQAGATGSIVGTVMDTTGAVIPGVRITITNGATNVSFHTVTSSAGNYVAPSLLPGIYTVSATSKGFQVSETSRINLAVGQTVRINVTMKPGEVTQTTRVVAHAVALQTDTNAISTLMTQQQVSQLPLNGRNFMQLLLLSPGTVTVGGEQGTMRQGKGNAMSVNGGRPAGNAYTLDGLVNTDQAMMTPAVIPSQDAIKEFQVQSGIYSAQYGFSASQVNIVTRSGTNKLHGTFFEYNRNNAYDAVPFPTATDYQSGIATSNPVLHQNQFGFVLDGPVVIPKIYNGHDRTFFMANYEGWRIINGTRVTAAIPNPAVLGGNFSQERDIAGNPLPAFGTPACAALLAIQQNCMPVNPATGQPFPNNTIPQQDITNRLALVALKYGYWPKPTVANAPEGTTNFVQNFGLPLRTNQQTYRIDQNLGKLGSIFGRYTHSTYQNSALDTATLNYGLLTQFETENSWELSHTISIGASMVNNFRFGYLGANAPQGAPAPPSDAVSALGMTGVFTHFGPLQQSWPSLALSQFSTTGGPVNAYTGSQNPNWEFADSFSWVHGSQNFNMGIDYRRWHLIRNLDDDFYGDWAFHANNVLTNSANCPNAPVSVNGGAPQSLCGTGNAIADMMLGYYQNAAGFMPGPLSPTDQAGNPQDHIFSYWGPYFEDNWKVNKKLNIDFGLRWDFRTAAREVQNHFFWWDTKNPEGGLCYADPKLTTNGVAPGVGKNGGPILRYCGSDPHPGSKSPFSPRFGFTYMLTPNTVLRGGYGIFHDSTEGREIDDSADIYPYSIRLSETPTTDPTLSKFGNDMFPSFTTLGPFPVSTLSFIAVIESNNPRSPYVQSWTLGVQRQLGSDTVLKVNYVGTHSVHLLDRRDIAQALPPTPADLPFCQADPTDVSHNCPVITRLPFPNFTGDFINSDFAGYSHYNAMNVSLTHRSAQLAITMAYTWAKSLDDKSAAAGVGATGTGYQGFMNNHDPALDYGPSDFDVPQRFVSSYIYQLPFGRGKRLLSGVNRGVNAVIGGWQLSGITTFQTGFPFSMSATDEDGLLDTIFQRANLVPGCNINGNRTKQFQRINMACFSQPAIGVYGNTGRNFLRQPGINDWDMGLQKTFQIFDRLDFALRFDSFNTFNHHQYIVGTGAFATGGSGGGSAIDATLGDSLAGQITSAAPARVLQLSGKIQF